MKIFTDEDTMGFTLIELLISIAIIGILMTIAIPTYQQYTRRAHFSEIVQATAPFKLGVEECYQNLGALDNCNAGQNGVPAAIASGSGAGLIDSISTTKGKVVVTPKALYGIAATDTYELTPTATNGVLVWTTGGGGVKKGYAN